jgi:integrase
MHDADYTGIMAIYRRAYRDKQSGELMTCDTYSYDFIFHGQRYRGSTDCTSKTRAKGYVDDLRKRLERGLAGMPVEEPKLRVRTVAVALDDFEQHYAVDHAPKSLALVEERGAHLRRLLGSEIAAALTDVRVQGYRSRRLAEKAGARTIDMEIGILARAFGAKWSQWWPKLAPLDKGSEVGKVVSVADEPRILEAAAKSRSPYLSTYLTIAFRTGFRAGEARQFKWDRLVIGVSPETSYIRCGRSKTTGGKNRDIPMDRELWMTLVQYRAWYAACEELGEPQPGWYVFPFSNRQKSADPTRPITSMKSAWRTVKRKLKIAYRLHDARHTLATALAVAGVPEVKRQYLMGHTNENVIKRYTHLQAEDCRADLEAALATRRENKSGVPTVSPTVKQKRRLAIVSK